MSVTDRHIQELFVARDQRAMPLIYDRYAGALYGVAIELTKDQGLAKEVLQLSIIKIWKKAAVYDPEKAQLFTWMFQITRNTALDELRKKTRSKEIQLLDRDVYPETESIDQEDVAHLKRQLKRLDQKYIEVLDAIFYKGLTHEAAATHLSLPLGTLKTRLRNAIKELRLINKAIVILLLSIL